jgi:hypothetical protein
MPGKSSPLVLVLCLSFAAPVLGSPPASDPLPGDPQTFLAALEEPSIAARIDAPAALDVGRAHLVPAAGTTALVFAAQGRPCGIVLDGPVALTYRVEDPFSRPIAEWNLKHGKHLDSSVSGAALTITEQLSGAAVWGWDLPGLDASGAAPDGASLPSWLLETLDKKLSGNPANDLLTSLWNGDPGYRWALLHTSGDDLVLDVDPRPAARTEFFGYFHKLGADARPWAGRMIPEEIVEQPIGRTWWDAPGVDFAAVDTDLAIHNDQGEHVTVNYRTSFETTHAGIRLLPLFLTNEVADDRGSMRPYKLVDLKVDGSPAAYARSSTGELFVALPAPLPAKGSVRVEATTEGDVLDHPGGDNFWWLTSGSWYPHPGFGGLEWAGFHITVEAAPPFVPFAPGKILRRTDGPGANVVETRLQGPMGHINVLAGKYSSVTEKDGDDTVHVSTYASVKQDEAQRVAQIALTIEDCLAKWLDTPYPFPELEMVEVNDWGWGQAPPGMIFITQEAFMTPARAQMEQNQALASWATRGINERVAHEVAHGWFPHVAKVITGEENWLSESFADYTSAVCLQKRMSDRRRGKFLFDRQLADWKTYAKQARGTSIFFANHLSSKDSDAAMDRYYLLYGKGPLVLHALRQELARVLGSQEKGDAAFFTWMRAYVKNFTYKPAATRHLVGILNQMTKHDWEPWFERYVLGTETPDVD